MLIRSRQNSKVKFARSLRRRKGRRETGRFLVEGIHHVGQAAEAGVLEMVLYSPELLASDYAFGLIEEQEAQGTGCFATTPDVFESMAEKSNPQGIVGVARMHTPALDRLAPGTFPWGVAIAAPQDPGNVGTILRTIDAVGASGLILLDDNVDPYHPRCVRASMGTLFWYPVVEAGFDEFAAWSREHRYEVYGTSAHATRDYRDRDTYRQPCVLLLGSEREGLSSEQARTCTDMLSLPMRGRASSLNLSVAAGVLLYAMLDAFGS